ncbi:conserved hypothetical protein [Alkaliphilus metalliredigens QYMF]|uniref:Helix-turn-helix domain protein n=1 Tax=Alkaliphilus metalliredigens (strain QYMF) TaxID=293826 RepID=A6TR14_ALKMQ|nr:transcriptional regulator [Alkaliphilus metalliredigens]ABR48632.1 conserved hypothetical protein [Alkaliphilus metalliredigens QYMF]
MFFMLRNKNKTVKELRKNKGLTAKMLATQLKLDSSIISKIDNVQLKDVPESLKNKILPILSGDQWDKIPW